MCQRRRVASGGARQYGRLGAIVKLHEFRLVIYAGPGGRVEIICPKSQAEGKEEVRRTSAAMSNDPERKSRVDMAIEMNGG